MSTLVRSHAQSASQFRLAHTKRGQPPLLPPGTMRWTLIRHFNERPSNPKFSPKQNRLRKSFWAKHGEVFVAMSRYGLALR